MALPALTWASLKQPALSQGKTKNKCIELFQPCEYQRETALLNSKDNCPLCISDWTKTVLQGTINLQNQFFVRRLNFNCLRNAGAGLVITVWWGNLWIHCPREHFLLITFTINPKSFFWLWEEQQQQTCCLIYCVRNLKLSGARRCTLGFHCKIRSRYSQSPEKAKTPVCLRNSAIKMLIYFALHASFFHTPHSAQLQSFWLQGCTLSHLWTLPWLLPPVSVTCCLHHGCMAMWLQSSLLATTQRDSMCLSAGSNKPWEPQKHQLEPLAQGLHTQQCQARYLQPGFNSMTASKTRIAAEVGSALLSQGPPSSPLGSVNSSQGFRSWAASTAKRGLIRLYLCSQHTLLAQRWHRFVAQQD